MYWILWVLAAIGGVAIAIFVFNVIDEALKKRRKRLLRDAADGVWKTYAEHYGATDPSDPWTERGHARNASRAELKRLTDRVAALEAKKKDKKEKAHD